MTDRKPRNQNTREDNSRRKPWAPPSRLQAPDAPDGYVHRWIRTEVRGEDDKTNIYTRLQEGWEPVRSDEYPDMDVPTIEDGKYAGMIGTGGLMLARIPEETVHERAEYFGTRTRQQMQAVDSDLMKEQHPSMPITNDRQSRVTFGGSQGVSNK